MIEKSGYLPEASIALSVIILGLIVITSFAQTANSPESTGLSGVSATDGSAFDFEAIMSSHPSEVDNSKIPITKIEELHVTGSVPKVDITQYRLTVDGLVDNPLELTYEELLRYPTVTDVVLLICPVVFFDNAEWTGVPVSSLLDEAGVKPQARNVVFYGLDRYQTTLPLEEIQRDGVFLAHTVNGWVLPRAHGFPLRLVVESVYGSKWVKWVGRIEVK